MSNDIINDVIVTGYGPVWPVAPINKLRKVFKEHEDNLPEECFLRELIEDLDSIVDDNTCVKCLTDNDYDSKFCKECGLKLHAENETIEIPDLTWSGDRAAETFNSIFIEKLVPLIINRIEGCVLYGDPDELNLPWKSTNFVIDNGKIEFVHINKTVQCAAPVFKIED